MAIKRVLLPFCDSGGIKPIAEAAFVIGRLFSAQVRAVFARPPHLTLPINDENMTPEVFRRDAEKATSERAERQSRAQQIFTACAERFTHAESEFAAPEGESGDLVAHAVRLADLAVLGSSSPYAIKGWKDVRGRSPVRTGRCCWCLPQTLTNNGSIVW